MVKLWSSKPSLWVRFPFPLFDPIMVFLKNFFNSLFSIFYQNRNILNVFGVFTGWLFHLLFLTKNNNINNINISRFEVEKNILTGNIFLYLLDVVVVFYNQYKHNDNIGKKVFNFKVKNLNNNNFYHFNNTTINNTQTFLYGLRSV